MRTRARDQNVNIEELFKYFEMLWNLLFPLESAVFKAKFGFSFELFVVGNMRRNMQKPQ